MAQVAERMRPSVSGVRGRRLCPSSGSRLQHATVASACGRREARPLRGGWRRVFSGFTAAVTRGCGGPSASSSSSITATLSARMVKAISRWKRESPPHLLLDTEARQLPERHILPAIRERTAVAMTYEIRALNPGPGLRLCFCPSLAHTVERLGRSDGRGLDVLLQWRLRSPSARSLPAC
jgi:hypothetical protein